MTSSSPEGYSGTPLVRKLGITDTSRVLLDGAPAGFVLPGVPAPHQRIGRTPYEDAVLFCPDRARLERRWAAVHAAVTPAGKLWVAWPKRAISSGRAAGP